MGKRRGLGRGEGGPRAGVRALEHQAEAISRAKEIVENLGGNGEGRTQGRDGRWRDSDSGSRNESPAKDTKH